MLSRLPRKIGVLAGSVVLVAGSYFGTTAFLHPAHTWGDTAKPTATVEPQAVSPLAELSRAFRTVHNAIKSAVVNISTTRTIKAGTAHSGMGIPDQLRKMLPPDMEPMLPDEPDAGSGRAGRIEGTGSGVIVSADGYILTNNHVVDEADKISVKLDDGRELDAKVIGRDPKTDLAVVKISAGNLTYAQFGDSDALDVGDWVLAFGSPFGFDQTMTQGIISAKGRQINIIGANNPGLAGLTYENFLQTDAAINPGNSGGPLVNLRGEIIGLDTAIASRSGAYNGIGFAIPSNDAKYIMDSLIKNGKVVRGYLGVKIADVKTTETRKVARSFGFEGNTGVLVEDLTEDSPGAKGGLERGDIITAINGTPVQDITQLRTLIARTAPGTKVTLTVYRKNKSKDLTFAVGTQPESSLAAVGGHSPKGSGGEGAFESNDLGISVTDITPDLATRLGVKPDAGVVVTAVDPNGLAADLGLSKGEIIRNVHGTDVHNAEEFKAALAKHKLSNGVRLSVRDPDGTERFVFIQKQ